MSGLFSWATDALASVKSTVIAPFRGETVPVEPEYHVTSYNAYRHKQNAVKSKKRGAQAKRRAQMATKRPEDPKSTDDADAQSNSSNSMPTIDSSSQQPAEIDSQTKLILAKMAEAAERRQQEEQEEAEAEEARLRKREKDLENSCVKEMPVDPLEAERTALHKSVVEELERIGNGSDLVTKYEEFQQVLQTKHQELDDLAAKIDSHIKTMSKKCARVPAEKMNMTPEELRDSIQEEELKPNPNELEIKNLYNALSAMISVQNQKKFFSSMQDLINEVSIQRARLVANYKKAGSEDARIRAIERLAVLYETLGDKTLVPENVVEKPIELSCDWNKIQAHIRKMEKRFKCVLSRPPRRNNSRLCRIWGYEQNCDEMIEWFKKVNWNGESRTYEKRISGAIVGRQGSTIQQLEQDTQTILNMDIPTGTLTVYGTPEGVEAVWERVEALKIDQKAAPVSVSIPIDPRIGRAILSQLKPKIQAFEHLYQCRLTITLNPDEGEPRAVVRCPADVEAKCIKDLRENLFNKYAVVDFTSSARAVSRLLIPPRTSNRASQLHNEFKTFQNSLSLFVQREQASQDSEQSRMWIVCARSDIDLVTSTVNALLKKADYSTERISIMREQQRVFNAENRELIEASTGGCKVSVVNNPTEGSMLVLVGSEEALAKGRVIVSEILEREGAMETVDLGSEASAVVDYLLRDRAAVLRNIEDLYAVSIHIDRDKNSAKIVGDQNAIVAARQEISGIGEELLRSYGDTSRLVVTVDANKVPMVIGRSGSTVQQIRNMAGIQSIDIPRADPKAESVDIVVVGTAPALEAAQTFIEGIVNRPSSAANTGGAEEGGAMNYGDRVGRGRGRRPRGAASPPSAAEKFAPTSGPLDFAESAFPVLGEVVDDAA